MFKKHRNRFFKHEVRMNSKLIQLLCLVWWLITSCSLAPQLN